MNPFGHTYTHFATGSFWKHSPFSGQHIWLEAYLGLPLLLWKSLVGAQLMKGYQDITNKASFSWVGVKGKPHELGLANKHTSMGRGIIFIFLKYIYICIQIKKNEKITSICLNLWVLQVINNLIPTVHRERYVQQEPKVKCFWKLGIFPVLSKVIMPTKHSQTKPWFH